MVLFVRKRLTRHVFRGSFGQYWIGILEVKSSWWPYYFIYLIKVISFFSQLPVFVKQSLLPFVFFNPLSHNLYYIVFIFLVYLFIYSERPICLSDHIHIKKIPIRTNSHLTCFFCSETRINALCHDINEITFAEIKQLIKHENFR